MCVAFEKWPFNRNYYLTNEQIISVLNSWNERKNMNDCATLSHGTELHVWSNFIGRGKTPKKKQTRHQTDTKILFTILFAWTIRSLVDTSKWSFVWMQVTDDEAKKKEMAKVRWKMSTWWNSLWQRNKNCIASSIDWIHKAFDERDREKKMVCLAF